MTPQDKFLTDARTASTKVFNGILELVKLQEQWNALDYGSNPFTGTNQNIGVTSAQAGNAVFATANAMKALLDQGHGTNLANLL